MPQIYDGALMRHTMQERIKKQKAFLDAALKPLGGPPPGLFPEAEDDGLVRMTETRIYVGLNDAETREQLYGTEKYLEMLKKICRRYRVAFSVDVEAGGYYHDDGEYTEETSLVLVLIDADREAVRQIANELRTSFHQESVLVTESRIIGYSVQDGM